MNCIAAVDSHWGIGCKGQLLVSIPADMRFFRDTTVGKTVIMGRTTLESFPGGKPLKQRVNIVVTTEPRYSAPDAIVVHSVEEALAKARECTVEDDDIYVIGGASIYRQCLSYCKVAYITKINYTYEADTFFPNLDEMPEWELAEESDEQTYYDLEYTFCKYVKKEET